MNADKLNSLKNFFESEYFTPEMLLQNISKYRDQPDVLNLLAERLNKIPEKTITFYSPQFCQLLIKTEVQQLFDFFKQQCSQSMSMFFNLYWLLGAYLQLEKQKKKKQKIDQFLRQMEMAMVNGQFNEKRFESLDQEEQNKILLRDFQEKDLRQEYFTEVQKFMGTLIKHSLVLKEFAREDRKHHLKLLIQKQNQSLQRIVKKFQLGISLPFYDDDKQQSNSYCIVNILEKHQICFHTKKRVPYLILVETIKDSPIEMNQYQVIPAQLQPNIEVAGYIEAQLNDQGFERQMAQIDVEEQKLYHEALEKIMKMEKKGKRQSQIMQSIDQYMQKQVKKQQISDDQDKKKMEQQQQDSFQRKRLLSLQSTRQPQNQRKSRSQEKNEEKYQEFQKQLQMILPVEKLYMLKKFKKRNFQLWEQSWEEKIQNYKKESRYQNFPSFKIRPIIIKGGDDLRQEMFAIQMMKQFNRIFKESDLKLYLRPYQIIVTSANSGIVEYIPNTTSIDSLKKMFGNGTKTLYQIYQEVFGNSFEEAQKNFIESLASYSLFSYLMQIKDRHNGNLLIDDRGHIIHIDFGFLLQTSPGGVNFESAPFKLTQEYVELMKGRESDYFGYFKTLMTKGFLALKKYVIEIENFFKIMVEKSDLPCFGNLDLKAFTNRFQLNATDQEIMGLVDRLINQSLSSWRTAQYDNFQKRTNGILP
ncbi:unnamed protein product (macronuclear) [Paramecium tetraurelia]|uniref:1-phosphatidylinositol 4-kinase n=1 Tax=Paramecium tetraurelia TaxID=5888 RepID=A0EHU5_PARTE|nr:uncharacterized protein GSPATT00027213001 [Paramecium tetraurelia]CAK94886.1 unnamed protein product [Paramecium tetraurelia]|eukprot:XP_001462259.1 hypothetical protein (macronuclear) [Paramecium tetraurelia strain d4-2]